MRHYTLTYTESDREMLPSLLDSVRELEPIIEAHRAEADELRRLPDAIAEAFVARDLYRVMLPADLGGRGLTPMAFLELLEEVASYDGSVAWNFAIGILNFAVAGVVLPEHIPSMSTPAGAYVSGSLPPQGRAFAVDGGYRVSGCWGWASGIHQSAWVFCGCVVFDGEQPRQREDGTPVVTHALLPVDEVDVLDSWYVGGMRGTGSTEFAVDDVFVPLERAFAVFQTPPFHPAPLFRMGTMLFGPPFGMIALGIARRVTEGLVDLAASKDPHRVGWSKLARRSSAQYTVARAQASVEAARDYLVGSLGDCWDAVVDRRAPSIASRARLRRAQVYASEVAAETVDAIYRAAGGDALFERNPFERALRDVHAIQGHVMLHREVMENAGMVAFGIPPAYPAF